jgi:hypothetical protein
MINVLLLNQKPTIIDINYISRRKKENRELEKPSSSTASN